MARRSSILRLAVLVVLFACAQCPAHRVCWSEEAPAVPVEAGQAAAIDEGFEGDFPSLHTYQATYAADSSRAHAGERSLCVTPAEQSGAAYFRLDGLVDLKSDYEFSAWVYVGRTGSARLYISASDGNRRYVKAAASGGLADTWVRLTGALRGEEWRETDREVMLAMAATGECWFDDVVVRRTKLPPPPTRVYPALLRALRTLADSHALSLPPGGEVTSDARGAALAVDLTGEPPSLVGEAAVEIGPDGLLLFAVDAPRATYVTGSTELAPAEDLRPGLRVTVLCDDTVVGAPMVRADPWQSVGDPLTGSAPDITGDRPEAHVELARWLMPAGRHYLLIAGPHFRSGGRFEGLRLRALDDPVQEPLYRFALLSDTHVGNGSGVWMNNKLSGPSGAQLAETLASLKEEGLAFAFIAGDMTDTATREQFAMLAGACATGGLPVYGCVGNHDSYLATSRSDLLELCPGFFPGGKTCHVVNRPPLRFVVLDGSHWKSAEGFLDAYDRDQAKGIGPTPEELEWLRRVLAEDPQTPTLLVWHYPLYARGEPTSCGYRPPAATGSGQVLEALAQAPNVVAVLTGHTHWNVAGTAAGIAHLVNPAFCEWPNAYRVLRVYPGRVEWELRQVANRGFVRESFVPDKALSWMISTSEDDLSGEFGL